MLEFLHVHIKQSRDEFLFVQVIESSGMNDFSQLWMKSIENVLSLL